MRCYTAKQCFLYGLEPCWEVCLPACLGCCYCSLSFRFVVYMLGLRERPCGVFSTMEQCIPQDHSLFYLDPTREFFRKGNNRTTIAGPKSPIHKVVCVCRGGVCLFDCLFVCFVLFCFCVSVIDSIALKSEHVLETK